MQTEANDKKFKWYMNWESARFYIRCPSGARCKTKTGYKCAKFGLRMYHDGEPKNGKRIYCPYARNACYFNKGANKCKYNHFAAKQVLGAPRCPWGDGTKCYDPNTCIVAHDSINKSAKNHHDILDEMWKDEKKSPSQRRDNDDNDNDEAKSRSKSKEKEPRKSSTTKSRKRRSRKQEVDEKEEEKAEQEEPTPGNDDNDDVSESDDNDNDVDPDTGDKSNDSGDTVDEQKKDSKEWPQRSSWSSRGRGRGSWRGGWSSNKWGSKWSGNKWWSNKWKWNNSSSWNSKWKSGSKWNSSSSTVPVLNSSDVPAWDGPLDIGAVLVMCPQIYWSKCRGSCGRYGVKYGHLDDNRLAYHLRSKVVCCRATGYCKLEGKQCKFRHLRPKTIINAVGGCVWGNCNDHESCIYDHRRMFSTKSARAGSGNVTSYNKDSNAAQKNAPFVWMHGAQMRQLPMIPGPPSSLAAAASAPWTSLAGATTPFATPAPFPAGPASLAPPTTGPPNGTPLRHNKAKTSSIATSNHQVELRPSNNTLFVKEDPVNNTLLISFWCYFPSMDEKSDRVIFSIKLSPLYSPSNTFGKKLFETMKLLFDHKHNFRLKLQIGSDVNIPIQSQYGLPIRSWIPVTFIITCNPLSIVFKLNNEFFETKFYDRACVTYYMRQ